MPNKINFAFFQLVAVLFVISLILTSCIDSDNSANSNEKEISTSSKSLVNTHENEEKANIGFGDPGEERNDSVFIIGKYILFFGPSSIELENIYSSTDIPPGFESKVKQFTQSYTPVLDSLQSTNTSIPSSFSSAATISIKMNNGSKMYFNRKDLKSTVGMIVSDGQQPPVIITNANNKEDIESGIKKYFILN